MKYLILLIGNICLGQVLVTFGADGNINNKPGPDGSSIYKISKKEKCTIDNYYDYGYYSITCNNVKGYIYHEDIPYNKAVIKMKNDQEEAKEKERAIKDSLLNLKVKERKEKEAFNYDERMEKLERDYKEVKLKNELKRVADSIDLKDNCHYFENRIDPFNNVNITETIPIFISQELQVSLRRYGNQMLVYFRGYVDLGCVSSYENNRSKVEIKLDNGLIIKFLHFGEVDCSGFYLKGKLSNSEAEQLKSSPILIVRLTGTEYYHDIEDIKWKNFFIDKLECIN